MDPRPTPLDLGVSPSDRIDLIVPMRAEFGATLRTLAASVCADLGFSVDEVDDVRLAVSEVFSMLVEASEEHGERGRIELSTQPGTLVATLCREEPRAGIELDDLAAHILAAVTDGYEVTSNGITFVKHGTERSDDRSGS